MSERITNVEMLLMFSEDMRAQGNDLSAEFHARGAAHCRRIDELLGMLDKAKLLLERERERFAVYLPRAAEAQPQRIAPIRKAEATNG